jgi:HSP20 family molecular chaperone IbpA
MEPSQDLALRQKQEVATKEERTVPGRYYAPVTDIYETDNGLMIVMEMPGVTKERVTIDLQGDVLRIEGQIDFSQYKGMEPVYTEYNVGHYVRTFSLPSKIDREKIAAQLEDGVLTLTLPKVQEAQPRRISISG